MPRIHVKSAAQQRVRCCLPTGTRLHEEDTTKKEQEEEEDTRKKEQEEGKRRILRGRSRSSRLLFWATREEEEDTAKAFACHALLIYSLSAERLPISGPFKSFQ